ncbi:MAG: GGDEF domain-containing protein [Candidatus Saccharibacteria bacterium]|nr:GGDEF domain-containing protein [Moraxellaceae bacterium]
MRKESVEFNGINLEPMEYGHDDHLDAVLYSEKEDPVEQEIRAVLRSRYWLLRFPQHLESEFTALYIPRAIQLFHFRSPLLFLLFLIENIGIYQVLPAEITQYYFSLNAWTGIMIVIASVLSYLPQLSRWYEWYIGVGGVVAIAVSTATANIGGGDSVILTYAGTMYIVVVLYSFVCLRFRAAMIVGWMGGIFGIILAHLLGHPMNWKLYNLTYTMTSILGMCLAYALDRQERTNFLQACLLRHSVDKGQKLAQQLNTLSRQDGLTGLANRRHLDEVLRHEWNRALRQQLPLTLMIIDVDFFKRYNDRWGHLAGDECLQQIATLIASFAKRSGELASRYGGEEFVLLFPSMAEQEAAQQAERLLSGIKKLGLPNPEEDHSFVTVSIGVAVCLPSADVSVARLLRQADVALYHAKENGRNRYAFFNDAMLNKDGVDLTRA